MKPLQTAAMLALGLVLDDGDIALSCASHSGSPQHLSLIAASLANVGLSEDDLECPPDLPYGEDERRAWLASGAAPRRLAMNCSGKHAAMLRTCLLKGWPISGYVDPAHPLQVELKATVERLAGEAIVATGIDGCGAPVHAFSLIGLARAYASLALGVEDITGRIGRAMRSHPDFVGGAGRFTTRLMRTVPGLLAKEGAEGVYAAALPDGGAVALKISDGATRASEQAVLIGLRHLGVDDYTLEQFEGHPVLGGGSPVGMTRPILRA